jgi:hypothetical protein
MNGHPLTLSGSLGFAILLSKIIQPYTTSSESINWHAFASALSQHSGAGRFKNEWLIVGRQLSFESTNLS